MFSSYDTIHKLYKCFSFFNFNLSKQDLTARLTIIVFLIVNSFFMLCTKQQLQRLYPSQKADIVLADKQAVTTT